MKTKKVVTLVLMLLALALLAVYWYFPSDPKDFSFNKNPSANFSSKNNQTMQFYPNMRFLNKDISYHISEDCDIKKKSEMIWAFNNLEEQTSLNFYEINKDAEINVACEDMTKIENGMFIAGEGGPANVSLGTKFNTIMNGQILLLRTSECERPNIELHELLHALGFDHSNNTNNIMYPVSKCKQVIGEDIISEINRLYSIESLPDLEIDSASAFLNKRFLDANIIIKNQGLKDSNDFILSIYVNNKSIEKMNVEGIKVGYGRIINITNILVPQIKTDTLKFVLETESPELDKKNNYVTLNLD